MKRILYKKPIEIIFSLSFAALIVTGYFMVETTKMVSAQTKIDSPNPSLGQPPRQKPVSLKPMLHWDKIEGAVAYELEILTQLPASREEPASSPTCFFSSKQIYVNGFNADLSKNFAGQFFYWRVRGLDYDRKPLGLFSNAKKVHIDRQQSVVQKPIPTSIFNQSTGATLLYPVYAWIPIAGATKYEVEILNNIPENPSGTAPSINRIDSAIAVGFDYYDEKPRISTNPFYWRVRGLNRDGSPLGVYSDAGIFAANPTIPVTVATYGDSITHGGGSVSYSPADWEYSYQHYLEFPTINLGKSGDTSQAMVERFNQDVLPFQPQFLIILAGINSLRDGVPAKNVIADLAALKKKCLVNNIRPVFLTVPPINPDNIKKVFNQLTAPDWHRQVGLVNDFIRTQVHIDVAREMDYDDANGFLSPNLAVDGLHLDIEGKKKIAAAINANWPRISQLPWQQWTE